MTGGKDCVVCKMVGFLVGIGALNWGLVAFFNLDLVAKLLGPMSALSKVAYGLIGIAGLIKLVSLVKCCPCKGASCQTQK